MSKLAKKGRELICTPNTYTSTHARIHARNRVQF